MNQPNCHRPLNLMQRHILITLHAYRFATASLLAEQSGRPSGKSIHKRLTILEDQGLIAKQYTSAYKLQGRPAEYYLLPHGARVLHALDPARGGLTPADIKYLYKNKSRSAQFIKHSLNVFSALSVLQTQYAPSLKVSTKTLLKRYDFLPSPLPDAYLRSQALKQDSFFLDVFDSDLPFFVMIRRVKKYISYADSGEWGNEQGYLPGILMVCPNISVQKRLNRHILRELRGAVDDEAVFATVTLQALLASSGDSSKMWSTSTNDFDEDELISLREFEPADETSLS
jgi:predicted transcriptional regulator